MIRFIRHRTTRIIALLIGAYSLVVMAGWILGMDSLTRFLSGGINMKFVSAVLFLLAALQLYFMSRIVQEESETLLVFLPGVSLFILLLTITSLASRILGIPTGLEQLFLHRLDPIEFSGYLSSEGWPSFPTLINFFLVGVTGIVTLYLGAIRERLLQIIGYFIVINGCIAVIGYLLHMPKLYYDLAASSIPMALNTAITFIALGIGLIHVRKSEKTQ